MSILGSIKYFLRRLWRRITFRRWEVPRPGSCRARIFFECDEIARYRRTTSDILERQGYRESAIHSLKYHAQKLLKELE